MILDEEALVNEQSRVPPPQPGEQPPAPAPELLDEEAMLEKPPAEPAAAPTPEPAGGPGQARPATARERKMFDQLTKQVVTFLTSPQSADYLIAKSQQRPPEEVLAETVSTVLQSAVTAAGAGGIQIPDAVQTVTARAAVATLAALLAKGGIVKDAQQAAQAALALIEQQDAAPEQPQMEAPNVVAG